MFEGITTFFRRVLKPGQALEESSKDTAKERLHLVLMQDRARVSADFLELMKQELIEVIKKYVVVDEEEIDVRLINPTNEDGTTGAPELYATIPIINIRNDIKVEKVKGAESENKSEKKQDEVSQDKVEKSEVKKTTKAVKKKNSATMDDNKEKNDDKKTEDGIENNNDVTVQKPTEPENNKEIEESTVENKEELDNKSNNKEDVNNDNSKDEE